MRFNVEHNLVPPPILRILVLFSAFALILGLAFVAGDAGSSLAQSAALIDYDLDDDGLIEVATPNQWRAIHYDLNGDSVPESRNRPYHGANVPWTTGFPNAMPGAGCPPRDHDNNPSTPELRRCVGYELTRDINLTGGSVVLGAISQNSHHSYTARLVGNGFQLRGLHRRGSHHHNGAFGVVGYEGVVEGLGVVAPNFFGSFGDPDGGIVGRLEGKVLGSYVEGGGVGHGRSGGIAGRVATNATFGYGLVAHSFVRGTRIGGDSLSHGGLVGEMEHQRGTTPVYQSTCLNSYFSGDVDNGARGLVVGVNQNSQGRYINCVGDTTTDADDGTQSTTTTGPTSNLAGTIAATNANMIAALDYDTPATNNPFSTWDDYPVDGSITQLTAFEPRVDVWHFGDETNLPVLKAWGHDWTRPLDRSETGADTVNLCTRTLAVANEIIRHLKDNVRRSGVTSTPADVTALTPCTSSSDNKSVSITNLTDLVVTNASHVFNLTPERSFPVSERLTSLDWDDFAYLTNAQHFDLGGNALESLPPRLFQGIPLRYLDLSYNRLTSLPADLFAGVDTVSTMTGNSLLLNGNSLTDTGIPGRIFDTLTHLNGLDLSDNALTRVNTRWFEKLNNLGRKASSNPSYTHALGLHLAGNIITEHHYSSRVFTGVRESIVSYFDATSPAKTAGDVLRDAIVDAITAATTTQANLDLTSTDHWFNSGGSTTGYQSSSVTSCLSSQTVGPGRGEYVGGIEPDCQIQPHWTPPHKLDDPVTSSPTFGTTSATTGSISLQFNHTNSAAFVANQLRYRSASSDHWSPWLIVPITVATGTKSTSVTTPWYSHTYSFELRATSTTGPPSVAATTTVAAQAANWLTGFSAASGTVIGTIVLSWTAITASTVTTVGHSPAAYYYRYKKRSDSHYGAWYIVPDGSDSGDDLHDENGYTMTGLIPDVTYDIELVGAIDGSDADSDADYFTNRESASAVAHGVPIGLSASGGTNPGTINVTWTQQTVYTTSTTKLQVRRKLRSASWTGVTWTDVPDSTGTGGDIDTDQHNETGYNFSGLRAGALYDIQVRVDRGTPGPLSPSVISATATAVAAPATLSATTGNPGAFSISWTQQTATTTANAYYQMRYKLSTTDWPATRTEGWHTVPSSTHSTASHSFTGLVNNRSYDVELRFHWDDTVGYSAATAVTATPGAVATPTTFSATAARGSASLSWASQSATTNSEATYQLRYKKTSEAWDAVGVQDWAGISGAIHSTTSHTVVPLEGAVSYDFQLRFVWSNAIGASAAASVTVTTLVVPAPTGFDATAGSDPGEIDLSWNQQTATTSTAAEYQFRHRFTGDDWPSGGGWTTISGSTHSTTSHSFYTRNARSVEAQIRFHWGGFSTPVTDTVTTAAVATPSGLTASVAPAEAVLSWMQQTATTAAAANYQVRFKKRTATWPTTGALGWATISSSSHSTDAYRVVVPEVSVAYDIQLRFLWNSTVGTSAAASVTATPTAIPAVTGLTGRTGSLVETVELSWNAQSATTSGNARFQINSKLSSQAAFGNAWVDVADGSDADTNRYNETSDVISGWWLVYYLEYDFQIRLAVGNTYGPASAAVTNIRGGYYPRNVVATPGDVPGTIELTWDAQTAYTETSRRYGFRAAPDGTTTWGSWDHPNVPATSTTLTGLTRGAVYDIQYMFELTLPHGWPCSSDFSCLPILQNIQAGFVRPPMNFTATASTSRVNAIDMSWDAQTHSTETASQFEYRVKTTASNTWPTSWEVVGDGDDTGTAKHDESGITITEITSGTALAANTSYDIQMRFWYDATHMASTTVSATTQSSAVPTPTNFTAASSSVSNGVDLSWDLITDATSYQYRYRLTSPPSSSWSTWTEVPEHDSPANGVADEDAETVTGLTGGAGYTFELRAHTSTTVFSTAATATATSQRLAPPTGLSASAGSDPGEIDISWTVPTSGNPTGFEFRYKPSSESAYPTSGDGSWANVPDSGSDGRSDETTYTIASLWAGVSYDVQIRSEKDGPPADFSLTSADTTATQTATAVAAPASFSAAAGSEPDPGTIGLTWTAIPNTGLPTNDTVVQYQYRIKLNSASSFGSWVNIPASSTSSHTITGLSTYTLHDIDLRGAIDDGDDVDTTVANYYSSVSSVTSIRSGLARPAGVQAASGVNIGSINVTWTQQTAFGATFNAAKYQVRYKLTTASWPSGGGWTDVGNRNTAGRFITNLMNGEQYDIEVRFVPSGSLTSKATAVQATATALDAPRGFTATTSTTNAGAITLAWTQQTAVTVNTAEHQVRAKLRTASWTGVTWTSVPDSTGTGGDADTFKYNETGYTITGLTADQLYDVQVRFFMSTAIGHSAAVSASATASQVPVPTGFDADTGSGAGEIDLTWTALAGATGYQFRYKLASASSYPAAGATGDWASAGTGTSHTVTNLSGGMFYDVQLRAQVTGVGNSPPTSAERAQAQTTPGPASLTFSQGPNPGDLKMDWTAPANNAPVEHYEYRYKLETAAESAYSAWMEVLDSPGDSGTLQSDETTYTITGLQAGTRYHVQFRVFASMAIGYSIPQLGTQASRPVPPPTSFNASSGTNPGEVSLSWSAPTGVTILRYELRHRLGTDGVWTSWTSTGTNTSHSYTGLRAGMLRTFQLRAVMETVGASTAVATTGTPTPVPTPGSFSATTGTFPGEVNLSWQAVTGATSYEYRLKLFTSTWPADAEWESVSAVLTSTMLTDLNAGATYDFELRAAITNVGESTAATDDAAARSATFTDTPTTPAINAAYAVSAAEVPGRIAIKVPGNAQTFVYRHRTATQGEWSRWFKVTPGAGDTQYLIPDLVPGIRYEIQVRAYTGMTTGFTTALVSEAQAAPLKAPDDFEARESSGVILLVWSSPALYTPDTYEYRTKPTGTTQWSAWVTVQHEGDRGSTQRHYVVGLETGISHDFELRMQTQAGPSPIASSAGSARLRIPEVHSIRPVVRSVSVRAGDSIALTVDIYDTQHGLDNSIPDKSGSKLRFRWSEQNSGGGTFGSPDNQRRVTYTTPSTPGVYTVQAEAQPDGICTSHHEGAAEISAAERAQCTAIFTVRVTALPAVTIPRPDPVNPTGTIPSSLTDDEGTSYAVFTPAEGGTFTGDDVTINAPAAAVPNRTIMGITATVSDIRPDDPIPGATMTVAGDYYDIRAIAEAGDPPLPSFTLNEPATACLPFPTEFRADLSSVVVVQRQPSGELSLLSTKIRSVNGEITICATLSRLPATIGVARLGLVPAMPATPVPTGPLPDTGATAPTYPLLLLTLILGTLLLTGIRRISRIS